MSLHSLANHLQSAGRGEDKVLVHMTPGEVNGLQSLAMAHGGSLTINPETGLPEAGILKSLLPMLAGGALTFFSGGALSPLAASMIVGGGTAAATGSLKKGLMAGLGAYGGAGMGAGLKAMATPAVAPSVSGLSPTVAANTSTLAGTTPLAKVGTENILTSADDLLMQGAKNAPVGGFNPSDSLVFVKNAPVPAVAPANAADFMNQTNQAFLGKLPNASNLPVAAGGPRPFPADFPTGNSTIPLEVQAVPVRSTGSYYDPTFKELTPVERSGFGIRGGAAQRGAPVADGGGAYSGSYRDIPDGVVLKSNRPVLDVAQTSPLDAVPADANVASFDKSIMSRGPIRSSYPTVTPSKDFISASPIDEGSQYFADINSKIRTSPAVSELARSGRAEIIVDPTMTEPASITQYTRPFTDKMAELGSGIRNSFSVDGLKGLYAATEAAAPYATYAGLGSTAYSMYDEKRQRIEDEMRARAAANQGLIRPYTFDYGVGSGENVSAQPYYGSAERTYFRPTYTAGEPYKAPGPEYAAAGGLMGLAVGGPVEEMASMNAVGANTGYPMANLQTPMYSNPAMQRPEAMNVIAPSADYGVSTYSGEPRFAKGGTAEPQSSGYTYDYNPNTMQFTQTGGPKAAAPKGNVGFGNLIPSLLSQNPQPTTPNGIVSGGMAQPMMQPAAPAQPLFAPVNIPAYQTPEQQLGLGGFYDYMNQQMGGFGGYAAGGTPKLKSAPMNTKMAAVDNAIQKMQTRKGRQEIEQAALNGDFAAQIAMQRMAERESLNSLTGLGGYSDGGRLLKGPGDGVSDSIPASIGNRQPARLADGEFVVPARIVSEIGNGSTEAGARKLYAMMDRVQKARRKTTGKNQVAKNTRAENLLPA
jgi:hypothetical protein